MWRALIQVESCCGALPRRKEVLSRSVRRRRPREAGFTEQRLPPAPYSGRITTLVDNNDLDGFLEFQLICQVSEQGYDYREALS
ncbi:hypothetical protein SUGI_0949230 [Cryptomeria japonica]|nr:hypothetical protein SUGI_0949230 [Cryptomeria japonica]